MRFLNNHQNLQSNIHNHDNEFYAEILPIQEKILYMRDQ